MPCRQAAPVRSSAARAAAPKVLSASSCVWHLQDTCYHIDFLGYFVFFVFFVWILSICIQSSDQPIPELLNSFMINFFLKIPEAEATDVVLRVHMLCTGCLKNQNITLRTDFKTKLLVDSLSESVDFLAYPLVYEVRKRQKTKSPGSTSLSFDNSKTFRVCTLIKAFRRAEFFFLRIILDAIDLISEAVFDKA